MADGLAIPIGVDIRGGASIEKGSKQKTKVLKLALSEGDDTNPFQNLGISSSIIFDINSDITAAEAKLEVDRILKKFEGKIELDDSNPIEVFRDPETAELGISFTYVDLDTNLPAEFRRILERAGGQSG